MSKTKPLRSDRLRMSYCFGGTVLYDPKEVLGPRVLTDFEAVMIIDGFPRYDNGHAVQTLEPGSLLIARPGTTETYRWDTRGRTRHAYLHFDLESIPPDWPEPTAWPDWRLHPPAIAGHLLRTMIERALSHPDWPASRPHDTDNRIVEALIDIYITGVDPGRDTSTPVLSDPVMRAAKFMRERLDTVTFVPYTLNELAEASRVTPKHLCRAFQQELGLSPMKACRLMQFQLAIPLLAQSNLSIKAIAERCGFPDQLHFSRNFHRTFGAPPTRLRHAILRGQPPPASPLPPALMPRLYW